ncbi:SANT/Myb domain [Macleaya cordata]|uniref:SANT/Myb domain n=1 Tax=Macleaya cordata TaxID=56857 RepID=A0A200Q852_MACCD|nr:SANT/Myb domain [Macleaya cordata]
MVELDSQIPTAFDPFAEAKDSAGPGVKEYVHIRTQQRNGKKSLTTVQGLKKEFSYEKILKDLKKEFCCNGNVVQDEVLGKVIQLQGDQRKNVSNFLVKAGLVKKDLIKIHVTSSRDSRQDFSEDEESLIAKMFSLVGERWTLIAGRIPGRSPEEIEKYWTSRYSTSSE